VPNQPEVQSRKQGVRFPILSAIARTIIPRFALMDIGGKQTVEIATFVTAELNVNSNILIAPGKHNISRSVTALLLVSPETREVCTRRSIDPDDIFSNLLRNAARVIPIFCNVQNASAVFTRATTLVSIGDIHSIFVHDPSRTHDLEELRTRTARLKARARSNRRILANTSLLFVVIAAAAMGYVRWSAPAPYYDLTIDSDRATFSFDGKEGNLDKFEVATKDRPRDATPKILVLYTNATTFDATAQVLGVLVKAKIDLSSVDIALDRKTNPN
jgi:hypothetical protein